MNVTQKNYNGLPDDLNKEKIIFLKFDSIQVTDDLRNGQQRDFNKRNKFATKSNAILIEEAKKYPFACILATRSEVKVLAKQGYRYVLENDMMNGFNSGNDMYISSSTKYIAPFYILDLSNGDKYTLFTISQSYAYRYDYNMGKFLKKVSKKYKNKK